MSSEYHPTEPCSFVCLSVFPHYHVGSLRMGTSVLFPTGVYNDFWCIVVPWCLFNELINKLAIISNSGALDLHSPSGCEQIHIGEWGSRTWLLASLESQQKHLRPQEKGCSGENGEPVSFPLLGEAPLFPYPYSLCSLSFPLRLLENEG